MNVLFLCSFMNSSLQALSACFPLTSYFLRGEWEKELNRANAMGSGGRLAAAYAILMQDIWLSKGSRVTTPMDLKRAIGSFQERFSGFAQHDAQELLNYVLDGLHEDLNRVVKKEYIEDEEANGRPDDIVASLSWEKYLRRNRSVIVDLFGGLLKNTLDCPQCKKKSVKFDPYHMLSLPVPTASKRTLLVRFERIAHNLDDHFVRWIVPDASCKNLPVFTEALPGEADITRSNRWEAHAIVLDKNDKVKAIKAALAGDLDVPEDGLLVYRARGPSEFTLLSDSNDEIGAMFSDFDESVYVTQLCPPIVKQPPIPDNSEWSPHVLPLALTDKSSERVVVIIQHQMPYDTAREDPALDPSTRSVASIVSSSDATAGQQTLFTLPAGATIAHLRYLIARTLLQFIDVECYVRVRGSKLSDSSLGSIIFDMATNLPLAVVAPGIKGVLPHWLPTFDSQGDGTDGRHVQVADPAGCAILLGRKSNFIVTRLILPWLGWWAHVVNKDASKSAVRMPSLERAVRERRDRYVLSTTFCSGPMSND
jgi:hypothetical protein